MPFNYPPPKFLDQVNAVTAWAMTDCEVPYMAYVETARPIAGQIALEFLALDFRSVVKSLIRPANLRSSRHGRRGNRSGRRPGVDARARARRLAGIPDPSDMVADVLNPDRDLNPRTYSMGTRFLFVFDDIWERAAYTIYLGDAVDRLTWGTMLGVMYSRERYCPAYGRFAAYNEEHTITPLFDWLAIGWDTLEFSNGYAHGGGYSARPLWGEHVVIFAGTWRNSSPNIVIANVRIKTSGRLVASQMMEIAPGQEQEWVISGHIFKDESATFDAKLVGAGINFLRGIRFVGMQIDD